MAYTYSQHVLIMTCVCEVRILWVRGGDDSVDSSSDGNIASYKAARFVVMLYLIIFGE